MRWATSSSSTFMYLCILGEMCPIHNYIDVSMSIETTSEKFDNKGLTDEQVAKSREQHGYNVLTPPKRASLWALYIDKYRDPIIQILLVAVAVSLVFSFINGEFLETIGIFLAIILATTIGFYFERDAAKKFDVLTTLGEEQPVKVRRNGQTTTVARKDVVPGDLMVIEVGDEIPADGLLLQSSDLQIDESSLTGEPIINKHATPEVAEEEATYPTNVVLRSTMVMNGSGLARVTAIGDNTEIGKVARKATELTAVKTPLNQQLDHLAKLISKVGSAVAVTAFAVFLAHDVFTNLLWQGQDYMRMAEVVLRYFMMAVTLLVMTVPEGLPMAVTLSLALNMRRMLKSNNLVRKLHACETMGAVTVICTDKTGTLTENKMQVAEMRVFAPETPLVDAIALNTTAHLETKDNVTSGIGNPTEIALLLWLTSNGHNYRELRAVGKVENQLPFSTERKYMATVAALNGQRFLFVKGAPETIMGLCSLTDEERHDTTHLLRGYQNKAMRTLAFAYKPLPGEVEVSFADANLMQGLTLQGLAAISDPIRQDVPAAVKECLDAGIEVKIVTGDTAATAIEIARQIGIWHKDTPIEAQIMGPDFAALSDEAAYERVKVLRVMSRARPTDKQRLVNLLQQRGEVVAVTGDGTNDAPALNHAHVGLSLGSGTNVAKEASDMTLLDDSFRSIERAVMWGRSLYNNIRRFLFFQLVVNLTALLLVLGGAIIGTQMPLTVTQILWVNLIMDTFAAMALASLPPTREVMSERPRKQTAPIISPSMARGIVFCGLMFFAMLFALLVYFRNESGGQLDTHQLTIFFTAFVMLQFWNLFNAKVLNSHHSTFRRLYADRGLLLVLLLILAGQWLIVTFGGRMFRTVPLSFTEWAAIIGATSVVMWVGEVWRRLKPKVQPTNPA